MSWKIEKYVKSYPKLNNPLLIVGLPGIGNVGKVAVDFIVADIKAELMCSFFSYSLPNSVFVNEDNLVELPRIEMFYKKGKTKGSRDLVFLGGDIQPTTEEASYEFCDKVLDMCQELKCREIITLGGIGLSAVAKTPKVYITGTEKKAVADFIKGTDINPGLYGVVGPIVGVTGLMLGLAKRRKMEAISLLAETLAHPMYLGIRGSREIIKILDAKFKLKIDVKRLEEDIKDMETDLIQKGELDKVGKKVKDAIGKETNYIG